MSEPQRKPFNERLLEVMDEALPQIREQLLQVTIDQYNAAYPDTAVGDDFQAELRARADDPKSEASRALDIEARVLAFRGALIVEIQDIHARIDAIDEKKVTEQIEKPTEPLPAGWAWWFYGTGGRWMPCHKWSQTSTESAGDAWELEANGKMGPHEDSSKVNLCPADDPEIVTALSRLSVARDVYSSLIYGAPEMRDHWMGELKAALAEPEESEG